MTEKRSRRDSRLMRFAPVLAVAIVFAGGSALVLADGGGSDVVHGCVEGQTARANVIIVPPDQQCPGGTTPIHWPSGAGGAVFGFPFGALSNSPQAAIDAVPASNKANKNIYKQLGVILSNETTVSEQFLGDTPEPAYGYFPVPYEVEGGVSCPSSHPYMLSGGFEPVELPPGAGVSGYVIANNPVGEHGWYTKVLVSGKFPSQIGIKVSVTCTKVKPTPKVQKK